MNDKPDQMSYQPQDVDLGIVAIIAGLVFLALASYGTYLWWLATVDYDGALLTPAIVIWLPILGFGGGGVYCICMGLEDIFL